MGEPRQLLWEGTARWNAGRTELARRAWRRGLEAAERLAMPYDEARLHLEMGLHLPGLERQEHLERARDQLAALGATGEASLAEHALSGTSGNAATRG